MNIFLASAPTLTLEGLLTWNNLLALLTLTLLEIVLGVDNIIFIAILSGKLPVSQRARARNLGLVGALFTRLALLTTISWIASLADTSLFTVPFMTETVHDASGEHTVPMGISWRDVILIGGGLFLIAKATLEIHHKIEGDPAAETRARAARAFALVIVQIMMLDIVFSIDSVITAVGMAQRLEVMALAVLVSVGIMLLFAGRISAFIEKHPTLKMLALAFLLLIGVVLVADGLGQHISKGYIYFAMAFSLGVESLNILSRRTRPTPGVAG